MVFQSIGFHTALILNRLRNERLINEGNRENDYPGRDQQAEEQAARRDLAGLNRKLAALAARVEPPGGSGGN